MSEVQINAQRDLSIAGDVVGRDKITINLTRGLDELPTRYDSRVQNFLEYYLGAKDHPAPFGGRDSDLATLDAWLDDPAAPPYASLIAPAGRGKSALLAHWITRLASRSTTGSEAVRVVYFPISIRFNTNLETVVFASLAARMAHVYDEKVTQAVDAQQYRGVFSDYLRRTPPNGSRVLVVLDGLDEATGWEAGADLFPTVAPGHLHVIVAARPLALDKDETAWLNRLGWEMPNRAQRLSLAGLDREGVRDVLSQMGNPLDALATKIDLISKLYELSAGDPLLVRLYVEALLPQGAQAATLTPDDLAKLQPGLEAYFKRWFEEQQKLWGAAKPLQDKTVRGLLNLCAAALGPLKKDDVLTLGSDIFEDGVLLDEAATAVNRFIIGDGLASGYVFSHPRLAEYFAAKLTNRECEAWQARFLQYGRNTLTALENKTLLPKNAPAYVVQYYGAHLAQAKAPATDFYALVCENWLRVWEWLEGTPAGFLNDVDRAWQKAEAEGPAALGQQIRVALCFASVTSLSANISKDLLVACVKVGVISPALGLVMARQKPDPQDRAECLAAIAEFHPSESHAIISDALAATRAISDEWPRALVLGELAQSFPERQQAKVLREALSTARKSCNEWFRDKVFGASAPSLPECEHTNELGGALSGARAIYAERPLAHVLRELAPPLLKNRLTEALAATSTANTISSDRSRAYFWGTLALQLPESLLREALSAVRTISNEMLRAYVLGILAPRLPEGLLDEALSAVLAISDEKSRVYVLGAFVSRLSESLLRKELLAARTISDKASRARFLGKLVPLLREHQQVEVLRETLSTANAIFWEWSRAEVLVELAHLLPESLLREILSVARAISDEGSRANILAELAPRLPEGLLGEALSAARAISDEKSRANILAKLTPRLPERKRVEVLGEALSAARTISAKRIRAEALVELALQLPEREQVDVLGEALTAARAISDESARAEVWGALAPFLRKSLLRKALLVARAITDEVSLAKVSRALAPFLPKGPLRKALSVARAISDERSRVKVFEVLAPLLPESLLREMLVVARAISDEGSRAKVLAKLTPQLPEILLGEALQMARTLRDDHAIFAALSALAPRWSAVCRSTQRSEFEELSATLRAFARTQRQQLLQAIQALLPVIAAQGGVTVLRETARAIVDTAKWWP